MAESEQQQPPLPVVWVGIDELPEFSVNQMIVQKAAADEFVIAFGHLVLPVILGTPEQRAAQAQDLRYITVRPVTRLGMSRARLVEFVRVLQNAMERQDETDE